MIQKCVSHELHRLDVFFLTKSSLLNVFNRTVDYLKSQEIFCLGFLCILLFTLTKKVNTVSITVFSCFPFPLMLLEKFFIK